MASSDGQRRIDTRVEKVQLVQISRFDEEGFRADLATGRTVNISRGGLRLELHHPLPLRSQVELDLALDDGLVHVRGTVVYLEAIDEERCFMGIAFHHPPPELEARLGALTPADGDAA
ncbi:MAG: PilZ domain-containing protein [Acidobacteriota bacterium]